MESIADGAESVFDDVIYHATYADCLNGIRTHGVQPISYWSNDPAIAAYSLEQNHDEGRTPALGVVAQSVAARFNPCPDYQSIAEPITQAPRRSGAAIANAWDACEGTWEDSLRIVHSIAIAKPVP